MVISVSYNKYKALLYKSITLIIDSLLGMLNENSSTKIFPIYRDEILNTVK